MASKTYVAEPVLTGRGSFVFKDADQHGLSPHMQVKSFVLSISKPRKIIILVKAGAPVDASIAALKEHMEVRQK